MEFVTIGRILVGLFYVYMAFNDFYYEKLFLAKMTLPLPFPKLCYRFSLVLMLLAGLMVIVNFWVPLAALYLIVFVVIVTLLYHPLWGNVAAGDLMMNRITWFANAAHIGALLLVAATALV